MIDKNTNIPVKPPAPNSYEGERWRHTALRRRMIQGTWMDDLEEELLHHLSADRRESWGVADLSSNPLEQVTRQLAVLYQDQPIVTNSSDEDISALIGREGIITRAGLWPLMQRVQQLTLGLRECFVRIDVVPHVEGVEARDAGIRYRPVTPDFVICKASEDNPDQPLYYQEWRLRYNKIKSKYEWVADVFDIRDKENPLFGMYRINSNGQLGEDVSELYMGHPTHKGVAYPYRDSQGKPFLPIQLYRAEKTGLLWNAFDNSTLVYGSLNSAVLFSMYLHLVKDCCFSQKYVAGLQLAGQSAVDQDIPARRASIATDPASILVFMSDPDVTGQPLIGSFQPAADPEKMLESIAKYEFRVATTAGISSEVMRTSGDPRSGYALSISREGQREAQRKYAPVFRYYDEELLSKTAALSNRFLNTNLPESGYRVQYSQLKLSPEEMKANREDVIQKLSAGLISPIDAIMQLNPDLDDIEARKELIRIRKERAEFM
tara:strand:+ start:2584 stop:4056 length:1473 start_codon:yes stop_codon:yes gene_type:complete